MIDLYIQFIGHVTVKHVRAHDTFTFTTPDSWELVQILIDNKVNYNDVRLYRCPDGALAIVERYDDHVTVYDGVEYLHSEGAYPCSPDTGVIVLGGRLCTTSDC